MKMLSKELIGADWNKISLSQKNALDLTFRLKPVADLDPTCAQGCLEGEGCLKWETRGATKPQFQMIACKSFDKNRGFEMTYPRRAVSEEGLRICSGADSDSV